MKGAHARKVTLASVAGKCGVTAMTVSRALRQDSRVLASTRRRILGVAGRLGYQPDGRVGRPRRRSAGRRPVVDVVLGISMAPGSQFYSQLLVSIERALAGRGCDCVIRTCDRDYDQFLHLCDMLRESSAAATLVVGHFPLEQLRTILQILPRAMLVDYTGDPRLSCPYEFVAFDNAEAARLAVRHLLDLGRRRILLVTGPGDHCFSRDVEQGYREILQAAGVAVEPELIQRTDFSADGAHGVLSSLAGRNIAFDAVFSNDEMAVGVLRALHEAGRRVPEDVAVAGCDGLPMGLQTIPTLTTVALDYRQLGQLAVERALDERRHETSPCRLRLVPHLVARESTRKLPPPAGTRP